MGEEPQARDAPARWSDNLTLYEVNVRQYTKEGTLAAFAEHLPRLRDMGVGILWFMPIHPIGEMNRKGSLGSYYSVRDYMDVNPEFGTLEEFAELVKTIHAMDMRVILDWVPNHAAWDNPLTLSNPEFFIRDEHGKFVPPIADWDDVIDFDYSNADMRRYMIDAMRFWVEEIGIDGFRCDVAGMVPDDFWKEAIGEMRSVAGSRDGSLFILAEADGLNMFEAGFDATYDWDFAGLIQEVIEGKKPVGEIWSHAQKAMTLPEGKHKMLFTSNHDFNSWHAPAVERLGDGLGVATVLSFTLPGVPLVYSGQEAGLDRKLEFFDKDEIQWREDGAAHLFRSLSELKRENPALWHGLERGSLTRVGDSEDGSAFGFVREHDGQSVLVFVNLCGERRRIKLKTGTDHGVDGAHGFDGRYVDALTGEVVFIEGGDTVGLEGWGYRVLAR